MKIKLPNITGRTAEEQVKQIGSYLRQMVQELNYLLSSGGGVTREELEKVSGEVAMLSKQVEQLGIRLQEHIKGG
jgi:transcriptional regulator with AAA-type ATPase domain